MSEKVRERKQSVETDFEYRASSNLISAPCPTAAEPEFEFVTECVAACTSVDRLSFPPSSVAPLLECVMAAVVASTLHYALLRPIAKIELVDSHAARVPGHVAHSNNRCIARGK